MENDDTTKFDLAEAGVKGSEAGIKLRERFKKALELKRAKKKISRAKYTLPRYDDIFFEGLEVFDKL